MLDVRLFREEPDRVREGLRNRGEDPSVVDEVLRLDEQRRAILVKKETLQARRNELSKTLNDVVGDRVKVVEERIGSVLDRSGR